MSPTLPASVRELSFAETREEITQRATEDHAKLQERLSVRLAAKKITTAERDAQLTDHALAWENKLHATIAQRIERAHLFSFNLPDHRSALTPDQNRGIQSKLSALWEF